jgi:hypothetical protein
VAPGVPGRLWAQHLAIARAGHEALKFLVDASYPVPLPLSFE